MSTRTETVTMTPVWSGGDGDLGSDWITGYVGQPGTADTLVFVRWVYGTPGYLDKVSFLPTLEASNFVDTGVGDGGTLTGSLVDVADLTVYFASGSAYRLNGQLSASEVFLYSGSTLSVGGSGSTLSVTYDVQVGDSSDGPGTLAVADGGVLTTSDVRVGYNGGTGTLTLSGAGTTLTGGADSGADLDIGDGAASTGSVTVSDGATVEAGGVSVGHYGGTGSLQIDTGATFSASSGININQGSLTIGGGAVVTAGDVRVMDGCTLAITGAGSTLTATEALYVGESFTDVPSGADTSMTITDGAVVMAGGVVVAQCQTATGSATGTLEVSGPEAALTVTEGGIVVGAMNLGGNGSEFGVGVLKVTGGAKVHAGTDLTVNSGSTLVVDSSSELDVTRSWDDAFPTADSFQITAPGTLSLQGVTVDSVAFGYGMADVANDGSISGSGIIAGSINNHGTITVSGGTLDIAGAVGGTGGTILIGRDSTLEIGEQVLGGITIGFSPAGGSTLVLDDTDGFKGKLTGISPGDQIVLRNTGALSNNTVISATIGKIGGVTNLDIAQTSKEQVPYIPITGGTGSGDFAGQYFGVSYSTSMMDTVLTLENGNPWALSVDAPDAWDYDGPGGSGDITGAGITVGIISDSFNLLGGEGTDITNDALPDAVEIIGPDGGSGADEGRAMAQIVHAIAPDAAIDFATGIGGIDDFVASVKALEQAGCQIIVDDLGYGYATETVGGPLDQAIDKVVADGVTFITAGGNDRQDPVPIYGHSADPNALTVAAMNILATPSAVGGYITPETEDFSSIGEGGSGKPNLTGPDGGPTTLKLGSGLNAFFGTSAAAPSVAAVAALMMQVAPRLQTDPGLLGELLAGSATRFDDNSRAPDATASQTEGAGYVNALAAVEAAAAYAACFLEGTRIATARGEVAVEQLRIGEPVRLARGGTAPVLWLGHRTIACAGHPRPQDVMPVRVAAHAFGFGQPKSELWLSPDHAVFIDGVLIPVRYLRNGATIVQEAASRVTYWHVELGQHDVILAEGLPCESYLDTGNRGAFANGGTAVQMHPDFALRIWAAEACAPLVIDGAELQAARSWLLERTAALGHGMTRDPDLRLVVAGRELRPEIHGRLHRFRVPACATGLRLVSRSAVPAEAWDASTDHRRLGVAVSRVVCGGQVIALADPCLGAGWHATEDGGDHVSWRWTDGDAGLALSGGHVLDIEVALTARYWLDDQPGGGRLRRACHGGLRVPSA